MTSKKTLIFALSALCILTFYQCINSQTIEINTDADQYVVGESVNLLLNVSNSGNEISVGLLILFITPDANLFWGLSWSEEFIYAADNILLPPDLNLSNIEIAEILIPSSLPSIQSNGSYVAAAALVKAGTLELIGEISTSSFSVSGFTSPTQTPKPTETPFLLSISENGMSNFSGFEDVYLDQGFPNMNQDKFHIQILGNTGNLTDGFMKVTLMRIDTSQLPDDGEILDAWIDLYLFLDHKYNRFNSMMFEMDSESESGSGWKETGATWNTYDGINMWIGGQNGGALEEKKQITETKLHVENEGDGWYSYHFNDYGLTYLKSRLKEGDYLNIRFHTEEVDGSSRYSRIFYDSEVSYLPFRPVLFVRYDKEPIPTQEPTPTPMTTITPPYTTVSFGNRPQDSYLGNWEDTWVYKYVYARNINYSSSENLSWREHDNYKKLTHLKLDISELPASIEILQARLFFYVYSQESQEFNVAVDSLSIPDNGELDISKDTWLDYAEDNEWTNNNGGDDDRGVRLGSTRWERGRGWRYIHFNPLGLKYLKQKVLDGLCYFIVSVDRDNSLVLDNHHNVYSSEFDDRELRPYLEIIYKDVDFPSETTIPTSTPVSSENPDYIIKTIGNSKQVDYDGLSDILLDKNQPDRNLDGGGLAFSMESGETDSVSLLRITTNQIPDNAVITSTKLYIYLSENGFGFFSGRLHKMTTLPGTSWLESEASWNFYSQDKSWSGGADGGQMDEGELVASREHLKYEEKGWIIYEFNQDGINFIQQNLKSRDSIDLKLSSFSSVNSSDTIRKFFDGEYDNDLFRPFLEVTYYIP